MFGMKHTLNNHEGQDTAVARSRFSSRLVHINGVSNLPRLYPALHRRLEMLLEKELNKSPRKPDGSISIQLAPMMRTLAAGVMGVIFVGENVC
jgi:hypothetical protein